MPAADQHHNRQRIERWIAHGVRLVEARGQSITPNRVIWALIEEAVEVLEKEPDQEKRWLSSGTRSGGWNMVGMTDAEALAVEKVRLMAAMAPGDGMTRAKPEASAIDRSVEVLDWFAYANVAKEPQRLRKAAYLLARKGFSDQVVALYAPRRSGRDRQIAYEIKTRLCGYILSGLKADHDIIIDPAGHTTHG